MAFIYHQQTGFDPLKVLYIESENIIGKNQDRVMTVVVLTKYFDLMESFFTTFLDHETLGMTGASKPLVEFLCPIGNQRRRTHNDIFLKKDKDGVWIS
jgi:hypothetical protein